MPEAFRVEESHFTMSLTGLSRATLHADQGPRVSRRTACVSRVLHPLGSHR